MTANQITRQDVVELVNEAMKFTTNDYLASRNIFREFCEAFEIEPTKRQASKFRRSTGALVAAIANKFNR